MRFTKKERVDVKKFMEDMKANRTNRSYNSIQNRNRQASQDAYQNRQIASKCSFNSNEKYPPNNMPSQRIKYNLQHQNPPYQPPYIPYIVNDFGMTQHSQVYTTSPPFQPGLMNYSQTFNSPNQFINYQDSSYFDHGHGEINNSFSQIRGMSSKISVTNDNQRINAFPIKNHQQTNAQKPILSNHFINSNSSDKKIQEQIDKAEVIQQQQKLTKLPIKKQGKRKEKKMQQSSITLKNTESKEKDLQKEKKEKEEQCFKQIMGSFNKKIDNIAANYLSTFILQRLSSFEDKISDLKNIQIRCGQKSFNTKLKQFESSMMQNLSNK